MSALSGQAVKDTYKDLLHLNSNNAGYGQHSNGDAVNYFTDGTGVSGPLGANDTIIGIKGHILPHDNAQYDLGSAEYKIRHLFLSDNSLHVGDTKLNETFFTALSGLLPLSLIHI